MELLSLSRMAARLGVAQEWLREQAGARKVPALVAGKRFLFNPVAVLDALAVQAARPVSDVVAGGRTGLERVAPNALAELLPKRNGATPLPDVTACMDVCQSGNSLHSLYSRHSRHSVTGRNSHE